MNEKKIGCVQHDCQACQDRERQSVPAGLQNIDRSVIEQALEWVEAQPEPRMLGAAKIITSLREALAQPQAVQEPVAEIVSDVNGCLSTQWSEEWTPNPGDKLYTSQQAPQPLTREQRNWIIATCPTTAKVIDAIEQAHGITKGTT